jgi:hypothetical protein
VDGTYSSLKRYHPWPTSGDLYMLKEVWGTPRLFLTNAVPTADVCLYGMEQREGTLMIN